MAPPYYYTSIPGTIPAPFPGDAKTPGPPIIFSDRILLEHALKDLRIVSERADLVDGRRAFRVEERYLWMMQKDATGYFIGFSNKKYYFTPTDPVTDADVYLRFWTTM